MFGGSLSETHAEKITKVHGPGVKNRRPGNRPDDWRAHPGRCCSPGGYADVFQRERHGSGVVPQISMIMGPAPAATCIRRR